MCGFDGEVTALFLRHRDDLYRYVVRYAGDADLAEDVVQETFVRLRERPPKTRQRLRGWLYTVATNLSRDALSIARRRREIENAAVPDLPRPSQLQDPASFAVTEDLRYRVRQALDSLDDNERTALLMYQEGFRHREIADALCMNTEAVGSMVVRAAAKVAKLVQKEAKR